MMPSTIPEVRRRISLGIENKQIKDLVGCFVCFVTTGKRPVGDTKIRANTHFDLEIHG